MKLSMLSLEQYFLVLLHSIRYIQSSSSFWVGRWNPTLPPFKWKLTNCILLWYCLFSCTIEFCEWNPSALPFNKGGRYQVFKSIRYKYDIYRYVAFFDIDIMTPSSTICFTTSSLKLMLMLKLHQKLSCLTSALRSGEVQENSKIIGTTKIWFYWK